MTPSLRRSMTISVAVQGVGSLAPLLTIVALARMAGPEVQGTFATFKSWVDLLSSLVVFGFPQAFVYLVQKGLSSRGRLLNATFVYVAVATVLVLPVAALSLALGYTVLPYGQSAFWHCLMLALGTGSLFLHRLVRGIYLTLDDGFLFSMVTSAPAIFLMAMVLIAGIANPFRYDVAFLAAGLLTCLATWPWIIRIVRETPEYRLGLQRIPLRALTEQSTQTFLQSLAFTLQPVIAILALQRQEAGLTAVAFFSASTIVVVGINVLFGLVAPILFNRWSATMDCALFNRIRNFSLLAAGAFALAGLAALPVMSFVVPLVFGADYVPAVWAFQVMVAAIAPVAFTRILYPAVHAEGHPRVNTVSCIVRLAIGAGSQIAFYLGGFDPLSAAVWGWVVAEWAAALYSLQASRGIKLWNS